MHVLSQYVEDEYAREHFAGDATGLGYLLKDRVADVREFVEAVQRVGAGGTALDPEAGFFEVRVQSSGANHRLICRLERDAEDLGGSSIVCLGGFTKPPRTAARPQDYAAVKKYAAEFARDRKVTT